MEPEVDHNENDIVSPIKNLERKLKDKDSKMKSPVRKDRPMLKRLSTLQDMFKKTIYRTHEHPEEPAFTNYSDLASEMVGGKVIFATDDWFAVAENMLKEGGAVWKEELFTEYGKWMDGWETRRRRIPGHDWCIIELGCPGRIHGIEVSTHHFTGNYPPKCSIQGAALSEKLPARVGERIGTAASQDEFDEIAKLKSEEWMELVPLSELGSGKEETHRTFFEVTCAKRITHVRLNIYPDGGVARLRVHGEVKPDWSKVEETEQLDLVAMVNGGVCVDYSDAHYGHARNVIAPGRARKMNEGWETARRRDRPAILTSSLLQSFGGEWAVYRLGHAGIVEAVEIDTNHFKGNYPHSFTLEGAYITGIEEDCMATSDQITEADWKQLLPRYELRGHYQHMFNGDSVMSTGMINHVRLTILPDGGVSRMILLGHILKEEQ